jgi:hypothetical protein
LFSRCQPSNQHEAVLNDLFRNHFVPLPDEEHRRGEQSQAGGLPAHVQLAQQRERERQCPVPVRRADMSPPSPHLTSIIPRPRQNKMEKIKHLFYKLFPHAQDSTSTMSSSFSISFPLKIRDSSQHQAGCILWSHS